MLAYDVGLDAIRPNAQSLADLEVKQRMAIRARDLILTSAAWLLLAWWTRYALALAWDWLSAPMFELNEHDAPDWKRIWGVLAPFFGLAALLSAWLFYWSRRRRHLLTQATDPAQPEPLARTAEAVAGMVDEATREGASAIAAVGTAVFRIASNGVDAVAAIKVS